MGGLMRGGGEKFHSTADNFFDGDENIRGGRCGGGTVLVGEDAVESIAAVYGFVVVGVGRINSIIASAAEDDVDAIAAFEQVAAGVAKEFFIAGCANQGVVASAAAHLGI